MTKVAAFFDVDETLIHTKSMFDFYEFWCKKIGQGDLFKRYNAKLNTDRAAGVVREQLNREYYQQFEGQRYQTLESVGQEWFQSCCDDSFFLERSVTALKEHQRAGHQVVFVSGSMCPILEPIAQFLNVEHILCTSLILDQEGMLTGQIGKPQTIGKGKKVAMSDFCQTHHIDLNHCYAYGDDISDVDMLEATGNPICVGENPHLLRHAKQHGWKTL
ncbi:HAD family hydrolase [Vibrio hippocampi]|uniref:Phosphatase n=1 Tax=Vibrio hippocampi TaxID=654686 RepID=A0ABN8DN97_9VIBR|nr:HAD-IB family hydrolase [Vibrio hippocampi]CAH0529998.1 putative phosphatase [Vibrio hippocampi]